jgi:hypothetical protein
VPLDLIGQKESGPGKKRRIALSGPGRIIEFP